MTSQQNRWLKWSVPVIAAITAFLEAGHYSNFFSSEVIVLIFAILTAISAFTAAIKQPDEEEQQIEKLKAAQPQPKK